MNGVTIKQRDEYYLDGAWLQMLRVSRGWSIREFAKRLGISRTVLTALERAPTVTRISDKMYARLKPYTQDQTP